MSAHGHGFCNSDLFFVSLCNLYYIFVGQKDHNGNIVDKGLEKM